MTIKPKCHHYITLQVHTVFATQYTHIYTQLQQSSWSAVNDTRTAAVQLTTVWTWNKTTKSAHH